MRLRSRLVIGYGYLVGLTLVAAGSSMIGFFNLSAGMDTIVNENLKSVQSSTRMLTALERQNAFTLSVLLGKAPETGDVEKAERAFNDALAEAQKVVTQPEPTAILSDVAALYDKYRTLRSDLMRQRPEDPLRAYASGVLPAYKQARRRILNLMDVNYSAMARADKRAKTAALRNGLGLGLLVAVALITSALLSRGVQKQVLMRLADLNRHMQAIVARDPDRRLNPQGEDELADIAKHFNALLDMNARLRASFDSRLALERQLSLSLLSRFGANTAVLDLTGEQVAGDLQFTDPETEAELEEWAEKEGRRIVDSLDRDEHGRYPSASATHAGYALDLLIAPGGRPVGWLVRGADEQIG